MCTRSCSSPHTQATAFAADAEQWNRGQQVMMMNPKTPYKKLQDKMGPWESVGVHKSEKPGLATAWDNFVEAMVAAQDELDPASECGANIASCVSCLL